MPYILVENFNAGLDRRRSITASPPGTLQKLTNCHISRGGEIEKAKSFVSTYTIPAGTFGLASVNGGLWVFGSAVNPGVPAGINYQRLQHPDGFAMTVLYDVDVFKGKFYCLAGFSNGSALAFYDGALVRAYTDGVVRASMVNNNGIAAHLADCVNQDPIMTATSSGAVVTITGDFGATYDIDTSTVNVAGGTDNQTATASITVPAVAAVTEVRSSCTIKITGGTNVVGTNKVSSIKIDGIEILSVAVDWVTSNTQTAVNLATQINSFVSTPDYTASVSSDTITIFAAPGTGASPNGLTVAVTVGGNVTCAVTSMAGGVDAAAAVAQKATVTIGGTFEAGDFFSIIIDQGTTKEKTFGAGPVAGVMPRVAQTHKNRELTIAGSVLIESAIADPTKYGLLDAGAAEIDMSTQATGSEALTALGIYQSNVAIFARRTIQIWFLDSDPTANTILQVLNNIGTVAPKSVVSFSESDVFFLSDSGVRSLKARDASNTATSSDVGTPIDDLVVNDIITLSPSVIQLATAVIEPVTGRYWLAIGSNIYVFSFFPSGKISAWSIYQPGFAVDAFAVVDLKVYARAGNTVYLYGGADGLTYPTNLQSEVELPFLDGRSIATFKEFYGIDLIIDGQWTVYMATDPTQPNVEEVLGTFSGSTLMQDIAGMVGYSPVLKLRLVHASAGYARISKIAAHYSVQNTE